MAFFIVLACLLLANVWVTRRILRLGDLLDKKGLHIGMVWIAPFVGAFMTWLHLMPYERQRKAPPPAAPAPRSTPLPESVAAPGVEPLLLADHLQTINGFPLLDWRGVDEWLAGVGNPIARSEARVQVQRAWLEHLADALGPHFTLSESPHAFVLSSMETPVVVAAARFVANARKSIVGLLGQLAVFEPGQKSILLVLDDEEWYYHYVSVYYPEEGEFAFSGGMFIDAGCPHFVVMQADMNTVEPVIAHELTHSAVSRLALPRWLDEGIAVNTERKVTGAAPALYTPQEMRAKHLAYWGDEEIQQFWSGESFFRTDDGNMLSYDLARILVEQMAKSWESFEHFVMNASRDDAGAGAAAQHLGMDLGASVCAMFDKPLSAAWAPRLAPA